MKCPSFIQHWQQWLALFALSCVFIGLFDLIYLPAALMFGPMVAGIIAALRGVSIRVSSPVFTIAKSILGCRLAIAITPAVLSEFYSHWVLLVCVIFSSIFFSCVIGIVLTRLRVMPSSTAIWGSTPGAASAMIVIAQAYGADIRLVAFMQYFRVLLVAITATLLVWLIQPAVPQNTIAAFQWQDWFPPIDVPAFACTIGVGVGGTLLASLLHLPASAVLGPLLLGGVLRGFFGMDMQIPPWMLAISFVLLGWKIGLLFDRDTLRHVYKSLPAVTLSILALMLFCGFFSWILALALDLDPLTAYLANTPGGLEAVIAISTSHPETNISFIMTLQTARLILLAAICPFLTKWLADRYHKKHPAQTEEMKNTLD